MTRLVDDWLLPRPKGLTKTGGRQKGSANRRTREIADRALREDITPLEVMLNSMRYLWTKAHESISPNLDLAKEACAIANQAAPFCHPRLAAVAHDFSPETLEQILARLPARPALVIEHDSVVEQVIADDAG